MKTYCKHCNKTKKYHEEKTLRCPLRSRSLVPSYSDTDVYDEVQEIFHTPNAVLKVQWSGTYNNAQVQDGESTTIVEWRGHDLIDDDGKVINFSYYLVDGVKFIFTVTCDSTGQVSEVIVNDKGNFYTKVGLGETEPEQKPVLVNFINDNNTNAVFIINFDGEHHSYDVVWDGNKVLGGDEAIHDLYFSDKYKEQLESGRELTLLVCDDDSGEVSLVTYNAESSELISVENRNELLQEDDDSEVSLKDLNIDDFIIPLHDKQWVLNEIRETSDADCDDEVEDLERVLKNSDGSIVLGKPDTAQDGTYVMFGIKHEDYVDEMGLLDNILYNHWSKLDSPGFIEIGTYEGHMNVDESEHKGITPFITEVIGRSLFSTNALDIKSTADCKAFLKSEYNVQKAKRTKKEKWGKIEYRIFESDDGEQYTIVTYQDKLISHYPFAYNEDY